MRLFNPRKLRYARAVDRVGRWLFRLRPGKRLPPAVPLANLRPGRVLVLESHLIGDIIMAIPALQAIRDRFPEARITLVAGPWGRELLDDQGLADEVVVVRFPWVTYDYSLRSIRALISAARALRRTRADVAVDLRGDLRNIAFLFFTGAARRLSHGFTGGEYMLTDVVPAQAGQSHIVEYNARAAEQLGCTAVSRVPVLRITDARRAHARSLLEQRGFRDEHVLVGIHPGATKPLRHWRPERFAAVADRLMEDPRMRVLLVQGPRDKAAVSGIAARMTRQPLVMELPLADLPALLSHCAVLLGLDSGAVHVAAAVGVPTVVLFGPAEPDRVRPASPVTRVVIAEGFACRPCDQVHCSQPEAFCMDALRTEAVVAEVLKALGEKTGGGRA